MYLNDHQRTAFYESLGLNTKQFNRRAPRAPPAARPAHVCLRGVRAALRVLLPATFDGTQRGLCGWLGQRRAGLSWLLAPLVHGTAAHSISWGSPGG